LNRPDPAGFKATDDNTVELVEVYYKGDKKNEDRDRILKHYGR